mgnify:CR=1 FL=1
MSYRKVSFSEKEYFHIYSRGNSKQKIFFNEKDYEHFVKLLYLSNTEKSIKFRDDIVRAGIDAFDFKRGEPMVSIGAWVLMPNHFHIYLTINPHMSDMCILNKKEGNHISEYMRKLLTSYTKYINTKYKRTGGLFESNFKAEHIKNDNQAKYLFSYIHLNPIKLIQSDWKDNGINDIKKTLQYLQSYKWSSYLDYRKIQRKENLILACENFPDYFKDVHNFDIEILEWLNFKEEL